MIRFRPHLEKQLREAVDLYSTDDLRREYQSESSEGILLRGGVILRTELRAEILWRLWCERWVSWITLLAAVVGAVAAIVAAVEGWPK
jgi:hypothetical protein